MKKVHIMKSFFSKTRRNEDGSAAIEFAFTVPLLILTIVGIMEFAMILFLGAVLEGSLRDAARFGVTGFTPVGVNREDEIVNKIASATMGLVPITASHVTALAYTDFSEVGQPEPYIDDNPANGSYDAGESFTDINGNGQWDADMGTPGLGGPCNIVVYRVETQWSLLLGLLASNIASPFTLTASAAVRNEPFGNTPCGGGAGGGP
jgi:Flp pilus assembly pilin Flp